jgi:hypothetical protein
VRATLVVLLLFSLLTGEAPAQIPLDVGSPEAAFAGGPIHLSKAAAALLREHYQGDKVPLVPQPFRGKLDTAFSGRDWTRIDAMKKDLVAAQGIVALFAWEQTRFIATGSIDVAEIHALDMAATGATAVSETAVMMWFYATAVTLTDGHKCVDDATKDAYLDRLRGPVFEPVTMLVRTIADDRLTAMRDLAIRLEAVLAPIRHDDTMCRAGSGPAELRPDSSWKPEAAATRAMLPRHLAALAAVMRPRPIARLEPPKPEIGKPAVTPVQIDPVLPLAPLALPVPFDPPLASSTPAVKPEPLPPASERTDAEQKRPDVQPGH